MEDFLSPKYLMKLNTEVAKAILDKFGSNEDDVLHYIEKWYIGDYHYENFIIYKSNEDKIDLKKTLHSMEGYLLLEIAVDMGVETPGFIPSVAVFRNEIRSEYESANLTFDNALRQIEKHPDFAVGLANSALESIIKEIFKDERIQTKPKADKTLYDLTSDLLKEFQLYPESEMPMEIKTIGSSLLTINQNIEKLRSEKTNIRGKPFEDYVIEDSIYAYFIINSVTTVGLFLNSYYKYKFPKPKIENPIEDELPF